MVTIAIAARRNGSHQPDWFRAKSMIAHQIAPAMTARMDSQTARLRRNDRTATAAAYRRVIPAGTSSEKVRSMPQG
jgi:hypothetical protein